MSGEYSNSTYKLFKIGTVLLFEIDSNHKLIVMLQ